MRTIPKPMEGEYPPYAIMYIKLLPDDGQVLQHMHDNFIALKKLIYSLPEETLYIATQRANGALKKCWCILWMMKGSLLTAHSVLPAVNNKI